MATNVNNVGVGKPSINGAVSVGATTNTLPTSATGSLTGTWKNLGYISDDGMTNAFDADTVEIKAWGGDTVYSGLNGKTITWQTTLIEIGNVDVLKTVFGADNVTGSISTGIALTLNNTDTDEVAVVIDMEIRNMLKRVVLPKAKVTEIGDISYTDDDVVGYNVTFTAFPDTSGNSAYEYIIEES